MSEKSMRKHWLFAALLAVAGAATFGTTYASWKTEAPVAPAHLNTGHLAVDILRNLPDDSDGDGVRWWRQADEDEEGWTAADELSPSVLMEDTLVATVTVRTELAGDNLLANLTVNQSAVTGFLNDDAIVSNTAVYRGTWDAEQIANNESGNRLALHSGTTAQVMPVGSLTAADDGATFTFAWTVTVTNIAESHVDRVWSSKVFATLSQERSVTGRGWQNVTDTADMSLAVSSRLPIMVFTIDPSLPGCTADPTIYVSGKIGVGSTIDWGDGSGPVPITSNASKKLPVRGEPYTVTLRGTFTRLGTSNPNAGSQACIKSVDQWDPNRTQIVAHLFRNALNVVSVVAPPTTVTDMQNMFYGAKSFNGAIGDWDVSNVKKMGNMFNSATAFNADISGWNTSKVEIMTGMFYGATEFNQPIGGWNTSSVVDMNSMFRDAKAFNQPIGNWNTSKVKKMSGMFQSASSFDQPIGNWNTSLVEDMSGMFQHASVFNQPLDNWDTSSVKVMNNMFRSAELFDQPLNSWNTSKVENMSTMFRDAITFNSAIGSWDVSNVKNMSSMFHTATMFNQPLDGWEPNSLESITSMFQSAAVFNQPVGDWDISKVKDLTSVFQGANKFDQPLDKWDTSNVTVMKNTFYNAFVFNQPIGGWDTSNVTTMNTMLRDARAFDQPLEGWDTSNVLDMNSLLQNAREFNQPLNEWDTSKVTTMVMTFGGATKFNMPLDNWDVSSVTDMTTMFSQALAFNQDISMWDVSSVNTMSNMFHNAASFDQNISCWNVALIATEPTYFAYRSAPGFANDVSKHPVWGSTGCTAPTEALAELVVEPADDAPVLDTDVPDDGLMGCKNPDYEPADADPLVEEGDTPPAEPVESPTDEPVQPDDTTELLDPITLNDDAADEVADDDTPAAPVNPDDEFEEVGELEETAELD